MKPCRSRILGSSLRRELGVLKERKGERERERIRGEGEGIRRRKRWLDRTKKRKREEAMVRGRRK
jgi:hypothetical protein